MKLYYLILIITNLSIYGACSNIIKNNYINSRKHRIKKDIKILNSFELGNNKLHNNFIHED